jgi:hypothetical protein
MSYISIVVVSRLASGVKTKNFRLGKPIECL